MIAQAHRNILNAKYEQMNKHYFSIFPFFSLSLSLSSSSRLISIDWLFAKLPQTWKVNKTEKLSSACGTKYSNCIFTIFHSTHNKIESFQSLISFHSEQPQLPPQTVRNSIEHIFLIIVFARSTKLHVQICVFPQERIEKLSFRLPEPFAPLAGNRLSCTESIVTQQLLGTKRSNDESCAKK